MTTKGILISEKDCQPQRKEKTAKKKDNEDEEDALMKNITLDDLTKLSLDSESEAAKKFGCGTTRFKTMCVCCDALIHFFCLLISLHESISVFDYDLLFISLSLHETKTDVENSESFDGRTGSYTLSSRCIKA